MSENSGTGSCNTGCTTGVKLVKSKIPNLSSAKEQKAGNRPCRGKSPFNVMWCPKVGGWPPGSMVYTKCGFYFNLDRTTSNPDKADSQWRPFDFKFLFEKLLETMDCSACPELESGVKHWNSEEGAVNVAKTGETWCFNVMLTDEDGNVTCDGYAYATMICDEDTIKNPTEKPECWTAMQTPDELMATLLGLTDTTPSIGANGNWFLGDTDTGVPATGPAAAPADIWTIGANGNWYLNGVDTGGQAIAQDGADGANADVWTIGANGNWFLNGTDTGGSASGPAGSDGSDGADAPSVVYGPGLEGTGTAEDPRQLTVCNLPAATQAELDAGGITIAACVGGETKQVPYTSGSTEPVCPETSEIYTVSGNTVTFGDNFAGGDFVAELYNNFPASSSGSLLTFPVNPNDVITIDCSTADPFTLGSLTVVINGTSYTTNKNTIPDVQIASGVATVPTVASCINTASDGAGGTIDYQMSLGLIRNCG